MYDTFIGCRAKSSQLSVTVLNITHPKASETTNRSKIGDTDPESSLFPDTYKMLLLVGERDPERSKSVNRKFYWSYAINHPNNYYHTKEYILHV